MIDYIAIRVKNDTEWESVFKRFKKLGYGVPIVNRFHIPISLRGNGLIYFRLSDNSFLHGTYNNYVNNDNGDKDHIYLIKYDDFNLDRELINTFKQSTKLGLF